jgi:hypothetical protein
VRNEGSVCEREKAAHQERPPDNRALSRRKQVQQTIQGIGVSGKALNDAERRFNGIRRAESCQDSLWEPFDLRELCVIELGKFQDQPQDTLA